MGGIEGAYNFKTGKAPHCFVAGTIVATALGMIAIESIQPGDYVLAKDVDTGVVSYQAVLQTFENEIDVTYTISLEDEEIETTAGHPFYVEDEGFVQAQYLEVGDKIETADGESAEVESVKKNEHDEPVIIYNFEVMDDHTYYVGENSLLVHNTGSCGGDVPDAVENGNGKPNQSGKILNDKGVEYPSVNVKDYGEVPFPEGPYTPNNSKTLRSSFTDAYKKEFKEWWINQGREWPEGNVSIHHIKPLSKGGTNAFENLVPLIQPNEHQPFTNWRRSFSGK